VDDQECKKVTYVKKRGGKKVHDAPRQDEGKDVISKWDLRRKKKNITREMKRDDKLG